MEGRSQIALCRLWLSSLQLESYVQMNMKSEMVQIQQNVVQNQTATMLEIGTNLLNQTAEQTRKLTDVEAQVCGRRAGGSLQEAPCTVHGGNTGDWNKGWKGQRP